MSSPLTHAMDIYRQQTVRWRQYLALNLPSWWVWRHDIFIIRFVTAFIAIGVLIAANGLIDFPNFYADIKANIVTLFPAKYIVALINGVIYALTIVTTLILINWLNPDENISAHVASIFRKKSRVTDNFFEFIIKYKRLLSMTPIFLYGIYFYNIFDFILIFTIYNSFILVVEAWSDSGNYYLDMPNGFLKITYTVLLGAFVISPYMLLAIYERPTSLWRLNGAGELIRWLVKLFDTVLLPYLPYLSAGVLVLCLYLFIKPYQRTLQDIHHGWRTWSSSVESTFTVFLPNFAASVIAILFLAVTVPLVTGEEPARLFRAAVVSAFGHEAGYLAPAIAMKLQLVALVVVHMIASIAFKQPWHRFALRHNALPVQETF